MHKRQHVGRVVFASKLQVQRAPFFFVNIANRDYRIGAGTPMRGERPAANLRSRRQMLRLTYELNRERQTHELSRVLWRS